MHMIDKIVENYAVPQEYGGAMGGLLMLVRDYMDQDEINQVLRAYHLAQESCLGVTGRDNYSGGDYACRCSRDRRRSGF
jgi:glutamate dehydrogenase/leucine dehydrogenase